ncbi:MAG: hypothetical protein KDK05_25110 [Candidatus Competibacteraceae bacterium]|nr:hypothetical protein [Candidatus Competibacteraceae bacterium]
MSIAAATLPPQLADLRGEIYRLLPPYEAESWQYRFDDTAADADLSRVWDQFSRWLLLDDNLGVIQYADTDEQRSLITRAANGCSIDYDVLFRAAVSATAGGYAAAYSANRAEIYQDVYPVTYALYTAAHVSADRADLAANAHVVAHMTAWKYGAAQAQAEQLLSLMRSGS